MCGRISPFINECDDDSSGALKSMAVRLHLNLAVHTAPQLHKKDKVQAHFHGKRPREKAMKKIAALKKLLKVKALMVLNC